ncbi:MAG: Trk system potassium transporter TrkA [Planctomycetota bacterium]
MPDRGKRIVIVGAGEVGEHVADILSREKHAVTIVDPDPAKSRKLSESYDVEALVGDGTRADTLTGAGASGADLVVAVSDDDRVNMLASVVAKKLGATRVIVRLKDTEVLSDYRYFYKDALGFDVVLSTEELAAEAILGTVRERHALQVERFADGKVQLRQLAIRAESGLTAQPLEGVKLPPGVLVVAAIQKRKLVVPSGADQLHVGDRVYVLGSATDLDSFERMAGEDVAWRRTAVIMGAGSIGREIARSLTNAPGIDVVVIEQDRARAQALDTEAGGKLTVVTGDATDFNLLQEERIAEASVFVATTSDDELNLVACMLAKGHGSERTIALVRKGAYRETFDFIEGVDLAISPRLLCAQSILRFVRSASPAAISVIEDGKAEVLELVTTLKEPTKVKRLGLPKGVVVGAVVRGEAVSIPSGDTVVKGGDTLIVFTKTEALEETERVLRPGAL